MDEKADNAQEPKMKSPNERMSHWYGKPSEGLLANMRFVFGDLDQPVTDVMWMLAGKFLNDVPKGWNEVYIQREKTMDTIETRVAKILISGEGLNIEKGNLARHGEAKYALCSDLAELTDLGLTAISVENICKDYLRLETVRTSRGWAVILDEEKLAFIRERFDITVAPSKDVVKGNGDALRLN